MSPGNNNNIAMNFYALLPFRAYMQIFLSVRATHNYQFFLEILLPNFFNHPPTPNFHLKKIDIQFIQKYIFNIMTMFYCEATSLYNSVKVTNNTVYTRINP